MRITTKIQITRQIKNDYLTKEEAFFIARDLLNKWRMNDGFKSPEDPVEAYILVTETTVRSTSGNDLKYEFEALQHKSENLEYMANRFIEAVEEKLRIYSEFKYFLSVSNRG